MPRFFKDLQQWMQGSRTGQLPSVQVFPPLDVQAVADDLRVDEHGRADGQRNYPSSTTTEPPVCELEIARELERHGQRAWEEYRTSLITYEQRIARTLEWASHEASILAEGERILSEFDSSVRHDAGELLPLRKDLLSREQEYLDFRQVHRLKRSPTAVSERRRKVLRAGIVVAIVAESFLNGVFFARGSETGLIGGATQASVLSILNAFTGFAFGHWFLPQRHHVRPARRTFGWVCIPVYGFLSVAINLAIAHFRDLYAHNAGNVTSSELLTQLTQSPLGLQDVQSLLLFFLGMLFGLVTCLSASGLDDQYPGYGQIGRQWRAAINAYNVTRANCVNELASLKDEAIDAMLEITRRINESEYERQLAVAGRERLQRSLVEHLQQLANVHRSLIARYRSQNEQSRSTPRPALFDEAIRPLRFEEPVPLPRATGAEGEVGARLRQRLEDYIERLNAAFRAALPRYETVDEVIAMARTNAA